MSAKAGRNVSVRVSGAAVTFTGESTTSADDTVYQIDATAKRVWDRAIAVVVEDGGIAVDASTDPYAVNRLRGTITFASSGTRTITVSGSYLPFSVMAEGHDLELTCTGTNGDDTPFLAADITRQQLGRDCSGTIGRFYSTDTYLVDAFDAAVPVVVEFSPDRGTTPHFRAWALLNKSAFSGDVKAFIEESVTFDGTADADGRSHTWLTI